MCRNSKRKTFGDVLNGQDCNKGRITPANNRKAMCVNCLRDGWMLSHPVKSDAKREPTYKR